MPTNMNFKVSILPDQGDTYSLGSSTKKWKINGEDFLDLVYPIGAIYMSMNNTDPSTLFGGTWTRIKDTFLLAAGDTYAGSTTGGSATMSHTHTQVQTTSGGPSNNTSGGPSNNTSGGPSNNTSGSTAITVAQMPSHNHTYQDWVQVYGQGGSAYWAARVKDGNDPRFATNSTGSGQGHTHGLSSHTHSLQSHTHSLQSHTHTTSATITGDASNDNNMPPYMTVYMWQRTA